MTSPVTRQPSLVTWLSARSAHRSSGRISGAPKRCSGSWTFRELDRAGEDNTYYNSLEEGFHTGQLNLQREVPPELAQLANGAVPNANRSTSVVRHSLSDVSYYKGRLYLNFGVTPAVLLFGLYRELTRHWLQHKDAVVLFLSLGFLTSACLLWAAWQRYFAAVHVGVVAACVLALGLANFGLVYLPRGGVHEVAISCGHAMTMLTLALLWRAMHATLAR